MITLSLSLTTHPYSPTNPLTWLLLLQLVAMHLVDAHYCSEAGKFIGATLLSLSTMLQLELPHLNVLSKIDLLEAYGELGEMCMYGMPFRAWLLAGGHARWQMLWIEHQFLFLIRSHSIAPCGWIDGRGQRLT